MKHQSYNQTVNNSKKEYKLTLTYNPEKTIFTMQTMKISNDIFKKYNYFSINQIGLTHNYLFILSNKFINLNTKLIYFIKTTTKITIKYFLLFFSFIINQNLHKFPLLFENFIIQSMKKCFSLLNY